MYRCSERIVEVDGNSENRGMFEMCNCQHARSETDQKCPRSTCKHEHRRMYWEILTKERRYESNDSREIEKGSFSDKALRALEEPVGVVGDRYQYDFLSVGEGCSIVN